jgi:hypothetical protein
VLPGKKAVNFGFVSCKALLYNLKMLAKIYVSYFKKVKS